MKITGTLLTQKSLPYYFTPAAVTAGRACHPLLRSSLPVHSHWLNSTSIVTEAGSMRLTPDKHSSLHPLVPIEPAQEDPGRAQWCMASVWENPWPYPHYSLPTTSQSCANEGLMACTEKTSSALLWSSGIHLRSREGFGLHCLHIAKC